MAEDRETKILELARDLAHAEALTFSGKPFAEAIASEIGRQLDPLMKELSPTEDELHRAFGIVARENQAIAEAEGKQKMKDQLENMAQKLNLLDKRLDGLEEALARIEELGNKKNSQSIAQSRVSWKVLLTTASATLAVSAILVVPFLLGLLFIPAEIENAQTRSVEVTLDIAALVAAVLGGSGIAAAGIAYAARQLGAASPGGGPEEGG